jgi:hypothetical protein
MLRIPRFVFHFSNAPLLRSGHRRGTSLLPVVTNLAPQTEEAAQAWKREGRGRRGTPSDDAGGRPKGWVLLPTEDVLSRSRLWGRT